MFYLKIIKDKGVNRIGKLEFIEKNKTKNTIYVELNGDNLVELNQIVEDVEELLKSDKIPDVERLPKCRKCAYYEYCFL